MKKFSVAIILLVLSAQVFAFRWNMEEFPRGNQAYTLEMTFPDSESFQTIVMDIEIEDTGSGYNVKTTMNTEQQAVSYDDAFGAALGGSSVGMFAFGPMFMFGSAGFMLPLMLGNEDIRVTNESMRVMGMGRISMPSSINVDGHECVVIQMELDDSEEVLEFALADGVPFPCYSSFGEGEDRVELRLTRIQQ